MMLSCQYGPKSLRNVSNILLNLCHEELKQFWRQKGVQPGTSNVPNKVASECVYLYFIYIHIYIYIYTEQNYKCNTFDWHSCSQHANCTLHLNLRYLWHCALWKTAHFRVAFYCGQPKAHLCNNHAVKSASWYTTPVRWMDYLGKGEVLTNTDLDRFVNNIWEISLLCM